MPRQLIVVSGAPGTGKSTIAAWLAEALRMPLLSLDAIKETIADVLGTGDELWSNSVGDAAAEIIFRLSRHFPAAVAEGWWRGERRRRAETEFAGSVEVFCHCDPNLVEQRFRQRLKTRHSIHRDVINPGLLDRVAALAREVTPLSLGSSTILVDTTAAVDYDDLLRRVKSALETPPTGEGSRVAVR